MTNGRMTNAKVALLGRAGGREGTNFVTATRLQLAVFRSYLSQDRSRRKAIRRCGKLTWETEQPDAFEWLTVNVTPFVGNYCIFQFVEDNRVSIFVRSQKRANRGEILFAIEDIKLLDNAPEIIDALEATIAQSEILQAGDLESARNAIREAWSNVEIRVANDSN